MAFLRGLPLAYKFAKWFDIPTYVGAGVNILFVSIEAKQIWGMTNVNNGLNNNSFQVGLSMRF